jgi:hypothetical protein
MYRIWGEYSEQYRRIYVADVFGGVSPGGLEVVLYSENRDIQKALETHPVSAARTSIKRIVECKLIIYPMQMKSIHKWLEVKIKEYE